MENGGIVPPVTMVNISGNFYLQIAITTVDSEKE